MGVVTGGGGAAFNGGTITQELVADTGSGTGQALELQGTRTSQHDVFRVDYPHTVVVVDSDGVATLSSDDGMTLRVNGTSDGGSSLQVSNAPTSTSATMGTSPSAATIDVITGFTPVAGLSTAGGLYTGVNAALADASITAGTAWIWFDQTNGAAKLMVKGKSANGTVVAASIALS